MPSTIKISSGKSEIAFGGLQIQPVPISTGQSNGAALAYVKSPDGPAVSQLNSAAELIGAVSTGAIVPPAIGTISSGAAVGTAADAKLQLRLGFSRSAGRQLRPVEQLTGISQDRPEIVMVTKFQPAYSDSSTQAESAEALSARANSVGKFISGQHAARGIRRAVAGKLFSTALSRSRRFKLNFKNSQSALSAELQAVAAASAFMLNVVRTATLLRSELDLRDDSHAVDPTQVAANNAAAVNVPAKSTGKTSRKRFATSVITFPRYNVIDVMASFGYDPGAARTTFASTKLWLQLVSDLRSVLRYHSLDLIDASKTARKGDRSPTALVRIDSNYFGLRSTVKQLPTLNDIKVTSKGDLLSFANTVGAAYTNLYVGPHIKNEEMRLALIMNLISKELRYSRGLAHELVIKTLRDSYGYTVSRTNGNDDLFDAVLGVPGASITHVSPDNVRALVGLAQHRVSSDQVVLTFESDYIDTVEGTFSPGSAYYVDGTLDLEAGKFNPTRLKELKHRFSSVFSDFSRIETGLDLDATGQSFDSTYTQTGKIAALIADPRKLFSHVAAKFVDAKTGKAQADVSSDPLSVVYSLARTDSKLKALLFMLTLARLGRAAPEGPSIWDVIGQALAGVSTLGESLFPHDVKSAGHTAANTLADAVQKLIVKKVTKSGTLVGQTPPGSKDLKISVVALEDALIKGTKLTNAIDSTFVSILDAFVTDGKAITNARTRFSGHTDTMIAMAIFDAVCAVISRYADMKLVGLSVLSSGSSAGQPCIVARHTPTIHAASFAEIAGRLDREHALVKQAVSVLSATTQNIATSAGKFVDFLGSPESTKQLEKIVAVVGTGPELQTLFTEQQIMLVSSAVDEMLELAQRSNEDLDASGTTDADEEIRFLDEEDASPGARAILTAALATSELTATKGANKRIVAVGVPNGLAGRLRRKIDLTTNATAAFNVRQSDIVRIMVNMVNIQMPDIVFFPRAYYFELSRFTVKNTALYGSVTPGCTFDDVVVAVPTRDYGSTLGTRIVSADPSDFPAARGNGKKISAPSAFGDPEHAFLPSALRAEILRNHVTSHILESYVRVLTGTSFSEHHFNLADPEPLLSSDVLTNAINGRVAYVSDSFTTRVIKPRSSRAGLFSHLRTPRANGLTASQLSLSHPTSTDVDGPLRLNVQGMEPDAQEIISSDARTISNLSRQLTTAADPLAVSRKLLLPKQFDRIFLLLVDPDDFEIDEAATAMTSQGQQALVALKANGDVAAVPLSGAELLARAKSSSTERLKLRPRDHGNSDMAFEKYIVTIEPAFEGALQ